MKELASAGKKRRARHTTGTGPGRRRSRRRYSIVRAANPTILAVYGHLVSSSLAVRRDRFSEFVKRLVAHVRQTKGWTLKELLAEANVSKPVYYRWANGTWEADPEPSPIERFCDAAGWPVADAFAILWPGKFSSREATQPVPLDPDFESILQALNDPSTSREDLIVIQATFEMLMARLGRTSRRRSAQ